MEAKDLIGRRFTIREGYFHTIERDEYDFGGETGTVTDVTDNTIDFRLDKHFPVLDQWENELVFDSDNMVDATPLEWLADTVTDESLAICRAAFLEKYYRPIFAGRAFTLDGDDVDPVSFMVVNTLTDPERGRMTLLEVGQEITFGGGDGAEFVLRRVS